MHRPAPAVLELRDRFEQNGDAVDLATGLSKLLRRISLARFDRRDVAAVHGEERERVLSELGPASPIPVGLIERLETVVYAGPALRIEPDEAKSWIDFDNLPADTFDLVTAWQVLEHVDEPIEITIAKGATSGRASIQLLRNDALRENRSLGVTVSLVG